MKITQNDKIAASFLSGYIVGAAVLAFQMYRYTKKHNIVVFDVIEFDTSD